MAKKPKSTDIPASIKTKAVLEGVSVAGSYSGQIEKPGDHDWVKVELLAGQTYHFYLSFQDTGSATNGDSELFLFDALGTQVGTDDSSGVGANSFLAFPVVTSGTYFVDIGDVDDNNTGDYSLFVTRVITPRNPLTTAVDNFTGVVSGETIIGGRGADTITIGAGAHAIGEQGNDIIIGNPSSIISGGLGDDTLVAGGGSDNLLFGDAGNDVLFGGSGAAAMFGGTGNDVLDGQADADALYGGSGKDHLTGGTGADAFNFAAIADSRKGALRDVILDFSSSAGDQIDLFDIDAKRGGADNAFKFIGKQGFHDKAGELHFVNKGAFLLVEGDVNGDGRADFQIEVHGVTALIAGDFNL